MKLEKEKTLGSGINALVPIKLLKKELEELCEIINSLDLSSNYISHMINKNRTFNFDGFDFIGALDKIEEGIKFGIIKVDKRKKIYQILNKCNKYKYKTIIGKAEKENYFKKIINVFEIKTQKDLLSILGIKETNEMIEIENAMMKLANNGEKISILLGEYQEIMMENVDKLKGENFILGQIGYNLQTAIIYKECGKLEGYKENLDDALEYANNVKYQEIVDLIKKLFLK